MKTANKRTDSVKRMRDIRDKLSIEIMDMSFEQEKEFIQNQLSKLRIKKSRRVTPAHRQ